MVATVGAIANEAAFRLSFVVRSVLDTTCWWDRLSAGVSNGRSDKCGEIPVDSLITAAARALAAGDPLGALNRVTLRDDATALALRGIARVALRVFTGEEGSAPLDLAKPDQDRRALLR
jgi:hypothetical protein